jgi:hypothetical protein
MSKTRKPGEKCGTCRFFAVRNEAEIDLARIAKDESECAPGEWVFEGKRNVGCHGGPVRGMCAKWRERQAQSPAMLSTQWCSLWEDGGPVLRQANGSANRPKMPVSDGMKSTVMAMGAVVLAGAISALADRLYSKPRW